MRVYGSISALISQDNDQRKQLLELAHQFDDNDASRAAYMQASQLSLAPSAADIAFSFGGVTYASLVLIVATQEVTVKFNGTGSPAIPVRPTVAQSGGTVLSSLQQFDQPGLVLWRGKVTSIHLGNPSSSVAATVYVAVVGNAA